MASRQVFIAGTTLLGMLVFGRLADVAGPQAALVLLGMVSIAGVAIVWVAAGRNLPVPRRAAARAATAPTPADEPRSGAAGRPPDPRAARPAGNVR